ncbi:uncharacterized protein LOC127259540 [Andrographis paniculata]|uniref:uncharacterized protein LOC127259540 n=1 Tax=Andrographis paniculata TaxID=175694 RepID=UPI0021E8A074|nr:uncharacterized protein LOC127259540 [Andrographis paniculata]
MVFTYRPGKEYKSVISRFALPFFHNEVEKLKQQMLDEHIKAIKMTPFGYFLDCPKMKLGSTKESQPWTSKVPTKDIQNFYRIDTEKKFVRAICDALEEAAQKIAVLKVELRKKDVAIAKLTRKLQRARFSVVEENSEAECEDESDGEDEGDAEYGEETTDRMDVETKKKQLQEDEEDQTDKDSKEEKHGEEEKKKADGEEKQGEEEEQQTEENESQADENLNETVEERINTERRSKNKMDTFFAQIDPINESDDEGVGSLQEFNQLMPADESDSETCSRASDPSIIRAVMARKDRKRKKKPEFMTPVSTSRIKKARKTGRAKGKSVANVIDQQGTLSEDETNTIEQFLASFTVWDNVWQQGVVFVSSDAVLELLFDQTVKGEVIDAYLYHLCSSEYQLQHNLQKAVNHRYHNQAGRSLESWTKSDMGAGIYFYRYTPGSTGISAYWIPSITLYWSTQFLSLYMNAAQLWPMLSDMPEYIKCRHQGDTLDSGPLVCKFVECYARAGPDVNLVDVLGEDFGDVNSYWGTIAARILKGPPSDS